MALPLDGIFVLDFSTLLPGPLATLMLAEAGAEVVKVERPVVGEDMRAAGPDWQGESLSYAVLNGGKKCIALDLKSEHAVSQLTPLIERADILVEQFRPGVMERLGFGYDAVRLINPDIIYCSITGYGQTGPKRLTAGHDMNYIGDGGVLSLSTGLPNHPTIPPALIADVGGGSYPAVINILLALRQRDQTGTGTHIDIAMSDNVLPFAFDGFTRGVALGGELKNGAERLTGGLPRYQLYPTSDGRLVAVAAIEQKFWDAFTEVIELDPELREDHIDPASTIKVVGEILASRSSNEWAPLLEAADCCCTIVRNTNEVRDDPHFKARGIFDHRVMGRGGGSVPALPIPVAPQFRSPPGTTPPVGAVGSDNEAFGIKEPEEL